MVCVKKLYTANRNIEVKRLAHIDWMRGLACVLMFQTHCYDAWLRPELEETRFARWSEILGTLPAPLFLFLAGVSVSLTTQKLREKGMTRANVAKQTMLRGGEIFGLGLLFRIQEYALGHQWVPWTDLLRVDILNILGLSMMLLGILVLGDGWRKGRSCAASQYVRCSTYGLGHFAADPSAMEHLEAKLPAMAAGILHQWNTHRQ